MKTRTMSLSGLTLALSFSLTACLQAPTAHHTPPDGMPPTPMTRVMYVCDNSESVEWRYFPEQGVAVLVYRGQPHELHPQPVASGFYFTNGRYGARGKGDELQLEIGRMAPIACRAQTDPR